MHGSPIMNRPAISDFTHIRMVPVLQLDLMYHRNSAQQPAVWLYRTMGGSCGLWHHVENGYRLPAARFRFPELLSFAGNGLRLPTPLLHVPTPSNSSPSRSAALQAKRAYKGLTLNVERRRHT
jgi:hypothetical protein